MSKEGVTRMDATRQWVSTFNALPYGMMEALVRAGPDSWQEVTEPAVGDMVYVYDLPENCDTLEHGGEIQSYDKESELYCVKLYDGSLVSVEKGDFEVEHDSYLPMWGTMWMFDDSCDNWWLEEGDGIQAMSECGFRIYEHEEFGYVFGIDGAGYSFFEAHWLPLYNKRGLKWHDPETDKEPVFNFAE